MRIGALWFQPGITGGNFATLCYASFSTIAIITFLGFAQPYLLTEVLRIPQEEQGTFTGLLATFSEVILLALSGVVGATSDRVGRRLMFVGGFVCIALGYFVYPLADTKLQLVLFRGLLAIGFSTAPIMLSACIVDYIQERSRGRWLGTNAVFSGLGAMFMAFVLAKLPQWYLEAGASAVNAGRYTFWTASALCLLSAIILWFGLSDRRASASSPRNIMQQTAAGFREGWANPRLALAYAAAFIGRGDLVIISTFLSLWVVHTGVDNGISAGVALAKAGVLYGILQGSALLWAYGMGMIADRVNRIVGLVIALAFATVGYSLMGQIADPFGSNAIYAAIVLGIGEISVIVAAGTLMGQEARPEIRGAIVGVFGISGGLGIMAVSFAGGILFDQVGRTAPFIMMGILNGLLMLVALLLWFRQRR